MKTIRKLSVLVLIFALIIVPNFNRVFPVQAQSTTIGCATSSPASGAYTVTICLTSPTDGAILTGDATISAALTFTGTSPGVQRVRFYLDNAYLLTDYQSPYTFLLPSAKWADGGYVLGVDALLRDAFVTSRAEFGISFVNGNQSTPVNTNQFVPSTGIPQVEGAPFKVAAAGDGADGGTNALAVTNLTQSLSPNMFIYLGDVYEKGTVAEFYNWYGTPTTNFGRFKAITNPTIGNHEYENGIAPGYFDYWDNIPDYYSYDAGGWHFVNLNSNSAYVGVNAQSAQYLWLAQDLAANNQKCTIVYYHHPLFNIGPETPKTSMTDIWQLMAQNGVTAVLNGHDHTYQRWLPLDGNGQASSTGITEFVVGASGHGLQTIANYDSRVAYAIDTSPTAYGVLMLGLNPTGVEFSYVNTGGATLDSGVIPCLKSGDDTQAPTVPGNLQALATSPTQVNLSWSASSDLTGVSGYTVYRDGAVVNTVAGGILSYSDSSLNPNTLYTYNVDAFDTAGNHSALAGPVAATTPPMPSSLTFTTNADTYVNSGSPGSNYGSAITLRMDASPDLHSYIRFNVQGLAGYPITKAQLKVYSNSSSSLGISAVQVADNSWGETTMTYNNAPSLGSLLATVKPIAAGNWVTLDVTPYITGEGTFTFGMITSSSTSLSLQSRESGGNPAQLVLDLQTSAPDTQPPSQPTGLAASTAINPLSINLDWVASSDNVGVAGYTVYRDGAPLAVLSGSALGYVDTAVTSFTTYTYSVDAFDAAGNHSLQSDPVQVTTPDAIAPAVPGNFSGLASGPTQVDLSWAASSDNIGVTGYTLYRDGAVLATLADTATTFTDTTVLNGLTYSYTVDAFDAAGNHSAQSSAVEITLADTEPPSIPDGLNATAVSPTQVNLTWSASIDNVGVAGYTVQRDGVVLVSVSGVSLAYSDASVQPNTVYSYTVSAQDLAGNSSLPSAPVSVTTPGLPPSLTFVPVVDAYVDSSKPNKNFGASTTLRLDASPVLKSYLRFNVQGSGSRTIVRARLMIYVANNVKKGLSLWSVVDNNWVENLITYANAPAMVSNLGSSTAAKAGTWVTYDVTGIVSGEGVFSFGITNLDTTNVGVSSRENQATAPQLIIDFE